jgi:hypothetical protein
MANRKVVQHDKFLYGWDDVLDSPIFSADHGATWGPIGAGGAFQINASTGTADNIGDNRTTPGNNSTDATGDGQFNAGVETGVVKGSPHGTAGNYTTIGGGRDNRVTGEGGVVPGGQGNTVSGNDSAAWGRLNTVATDFSHASGTDAVTRNFGERAHGDDAYVQGVFQERVVMLTREIGTGAGNDLPLYTDYIAGGTEQFIVGASMTTYQVAVMVLACVGVGGGPAVEAAAWELRGVFYNNAGVVTQLGATTTTFIANSNPAIFDVVPKLQASGSNIQVTGSDDGTSTEAIRWGARLVAIELQPVPGSGA